VLHLDPPRRLRPAVAVVLLGVAVLAGLIGPAAAQDEDGTGPTTTLDGSGTTATSEPTTTTTAPLVGPTPDDPTQDEGVSAGDVPIDPAQVPVRQDALGQSAEAGRLIREELSVAKAQAVKLGTSYAAARTRTILLEAQLDQVERSVTALAAIDRVAVRRVAAARRQFETRAVAALIRGRIDDFVPDVPTGDPNQLAAAQTLLGSVLDADQDALREYLLARAGTDAALLRTADQLVTTRALVTKAREAMVEARRANVSAQINLAVLSEGSDIVIHGFVFPVGVPHSFGNSFGAPRMIGTQYAHSHQGTDILAPFGTPLVACERGIITRLGSDVLGGTTFWLKGESGTYYYYAHLSSYAEGMAKGNVVDAGTILGYVGDTGNAKGTPHLHFEIHPDGGAAVNPYPLLKVVDQLSRQAAAEG
jgi:murein DD-endopeptidase MepM/ murein hydrolase activator NlpD